MEAPDASSARLEPGSKDSLIVALVGVLEQVLSDPLFLFGDDSEELTDSLVRTTVLSLPP